MNNILSRLYFSKNINDWERAVSSIGGAALIVLGLSHRRLAGWLAVTFGSGLLVRGVTGHCQCYEALGISTTPVRHPHPRISVRGNRGIKVEKTFFVHRPAEVLYRTWRNFENQPHFMGYIESVQQLDS